MEEFKNLLKSEGFSLTEPRLALYTYLQSHDPANLAQAIKQLSRQADQASIYRTVNLFKKLGIIHEVISGGHKSLELDDRFAGHHHHLSCVHCGRTTSIEDKAIEQRLRTLAVSYGYQPRSHQVSISGICPVCQSAIAQNESRAAETNH